MKNLIIFSLLLISSFCSAQTSVFPADCVLIYKDTLSNEPPEIMYVGGKITIEKQSVNVNALPLLSFSDYIISKTERAGLLFKFPSPTIITKNNYTLIDQSNRNAITILIENKAYLFFHGNNQCNDLKKKTIEKQ